MGPLCIYLDFKTAFYKRVQNLTYITFNREELKVLELGFPNNYLNQHINRLIIDAENVTRRPDRKTTAFYRRFPFFSKSTQSKLKYRKLRKSDKAYCCTSVHSNYRTLA